MWWPATTFFPPTSDARWLLDTPGHAQRGKRFPLSSLPNLKSVSTRFVPPGERGTLIGRSVYVHLSGLAWRKKTNGELGEVFPAAFAVVIFMMALEFVGLHESSAWARSGLLKNGCRFSRQNRVFDPRPAESSV
jgi:hypothetical protein